MTVKDTIKEQLSSSKVHKFIRWGAFVGGILTVIVGVFSLISVTLDLKLIVNGFYEILFGGMMVLSTLRVEKVLRKIEILRGYRGLGYFCLFIGGLALGGSWFDYALAIYMFFFGFIYLYLHISKVTSEHPM